MTKKETHLPEIIDTKKGGTHSMQEFMTFVWFSLFYWFFLLWFMLELSAPLFCRLIEMNRLSIEWRYQIFEYDKQRTMRTNKTPKPTVFFLFVVVVSFKTNIIIFIESRYGPGCAVMYGE